MNRVIALAIGGALLMAGRGTDNPTRSPSIHRQVGFRQVTTKSSLSPTRFRQVPTEITRSVVFFPETAQCRRQAADLGQGVRAIADGYVSIILPAYLLCSP